MDRVVFISAMKAEIGALERELERDPRRKRLDALRLALATYSANDTGGGAGGYDPEIEDPTNKEIRAFLHGRDWAHKKVILKHLTEKGFAGTAEDPRKALGKRLWRMKDVEGDRKGNYRLKPSS
jgi:hypothetical protein